MARKQKKVSGKPTLPFGPLNYWLFLVGIILVVMGFVVLSQGSLTLAPVLLVLGYLVVLPLSILVRGKKQGG